MKAHENIELRNDEVNDILSEMPSWAIRWGSLALSLAVLGLIGLTFLIRYPDTIKGNITIVQTQMPIDLVAKKSGRVQFLNLNEGMMVQKGTDLAFIESEIMYQDFLIAEKIVSQFLEHLTFDSLPKLELNQNLKLGTLQNAYSQLHKSYQEYAFLDNNQFLSQEIKNLQQQVQTLQSLQQQNVIERKVLEKNLQIAEKQLQRDKKLKDNKAFSDLDLENTEKNYWQEFYKVENLKSQYLNHSLRTEQIEKNLFELTKQEAWRKQELFTNLKSDAEKWRAACQSWRAEYILEAPIDGKISFGKLWASNQTIQAGEMTLSISPLEKELMGQVLVDEKGFGKIAVGQKVQICLYAYNCQEYGKIEGKVQYISENNIEGKHRIQISLPNPLRTNYKLNIPLQTTNLQGDVYIHTDNSRLIEKIFNQMKFLLKNAF